MKIRRIIAREWLLFVALVFLGPVVLATYSWLVALHPWCLCDDRQQTNHFDGHYDQLLYHDLEDPPAFRVITHRGTFDVILDRTEYVSGSSAWPMLEKKLGFALVAEQTTVSWLVQKRSLWNYLLDVMNSFNRYVKFIAIYLFLVFVRSLKWSIRTIRFQER